MDDSILLRQFLSDHSEAAFSALVRRHVDLVYSAARRQTHSASAAEDVTQQVFVLLAEKARTIRDGEALPGWLLVTTRFVALNHLRTEARRRKHEREAAAMKREADDSTDPRWQQMAAMLDEAVGRLKRDDRDVLALKFFGGCSVADVATTLNLSPEAAQKRIYRALDKLRTWFADRGIHTSSDALSSMLMTHAIMAAPAALSAQVASSALASAATSTTAAGKVTVSIMAAAKAKLAVACAAGVILLGVTGTIGYQRFIAAPKVRQVKVSAPESIYSGAVQAPLPPPMVGWEPRFRQVYGLAPGELVKFVRAPYVPERLGFYRKNAGDLQYQSIPAGYDTMLLSDDGAAFENRGAMFGGQVDLKYAFNYALGVESWDLRGTPQLLRTPMRGDWVIRKDTTPEQRLAPFLQILSQTLKMNISAEKQVVPREAIVIRGKLALHPLIPAQSHGWTAVVLYRGKFNAKNTGYSGGFLADQLAGMCNTPVIDEAGIPTDKLEIHSGPGVWMSDRIPAAQRTVEIDGLLANIAAQTSLELKRETRTLPVWVVATKP